jgi:prevent-host-death family protein
MSSVGIRELKEHTSEIMRRVDDGETIEVTRRGRTIARIVPTERRRSEASIQQFWQRHEELVRAIAEELDDRPVDAVELVREQRRNLTPDEWVPPDWRFNR